MPQKRKPHNQKKPSSQKTRNNEAKTLEKKKEEADDQLCVDRLSDLPEPIIHQILLSLPPADAINTKWLSKRWRDSIWPSCPVLYFDEYNFGANYFLYYTEDNGNRRRFTKFLLRSLQKQKEGTSNYSSIDKFGIRMALLGLKYDAVIEGWLDFAVENNVKELDLRLKRVLEKHFKRYWLDDSVFACRSLTSLYLDYCGITLDCITVDFPFLKKLTLSEVKITSDAFCCLIRGCPLLEDLCVEFCNGLRIIEVTAPNLQSLKLNLTDVYAVSLWSPSLQSVEFSGGDCTSRNLRDFAAIKTLKEIKLKNLYITDEQLESLIKESPMLESLVIEGCRGFENVEVSQNVKRLSMFRCRGIVKAKLCSSKLKSLEYSGDMMISFRYRDNLRLADVKISLDPMELSADWFFRLKKLLKELAKSKVLTLVCPSDQIIISPEELSGELLPRVHHLKHLRLEISSLSTSCSAIVDGLIWLLPGLETLTIKSGSINKLIKF